MDRIATTQLELLRFAKKRKKGFTISEAADEFAVMRQTMHVRLVDALSRKWLSKKTEDSGGPTKRQRFFLTATGDKLAQKKWMGGKKDRYLTVNGANGKSN